MKNVLKRICLYLLIFSVFLYTGCYSSTSVDKNLLYTDFEKKAFDDLTIVTKEDERIIIQGVTYQIINDTLYANGINKSNVIVYNKPIEFKIALVDIKNIEIKEFDGLATAGCIIGVRRSSFVVHWSNCYGK